VLRRAWRGRVGSGARPEDDRGPLDLAQTFRPVTGPSAGMGDCNDDESRLENVHSRVGERAHGAPVSGVSSMQANAASASLRKRSPRPTTRSSYQAAASAISADAARRISATTSRQSGASFG
jgi:hypothetical protein